HNAGNDAVINWEPDSLLSAPSSANPIAVLNSTSTLYVTVTSSAGCSMSDSTKVKVLKLSTFNIAPDSSTICKGESVRADVFKSNQCCTNGTSCNGIQDSLSVVYNNYSSSSEAFSPFSGAYLSSRRQFLFRAPELYTLGMNEGVTITQLSFKLGNILG